MSPFYIVTNTRKEISLQEAPSDAEALLQVPNGESVRIAQPLERIRLQEEQNANKS